MHSFAARRILDQKQSFVGVCELLSCQTPLPPLGVCFSVGGSRSAGGDARPAVPQQRLPQEQGAVNSAPGQHTRAAQSDGGVQHSPALERLIQSIEPKEDRSAFPLGLYSASSGSDIMTIALQCGARIGSQEMGMFQSALASTAYPEPSDEERMYPAGVMEDIQMEVLRRNNISMPCKKNQRVYGTVYAVDKKRVWIDVGHTDLAQLSRSVRCPLLIERLTADMIALELSDEPG